MIHKTSAPTFRQLAICLSLIALLATPAVFAAGTDTWVGNTSLVWSLAANWTTSGGNTPPATGDSLVFGAMGTAGISLNNDVSSLTVNNWNINGSGAFTFGGNGVTLNGLLTDSANAVETISLAIGGTGSVLESGGNTLTLSGANSYSGGTTISAGTLQLGGANAVGTGNITNSGATLDLNSQTLTDAITVISSGSVITNSSGSAATVSAAIGSSSSSQLGNFTVGAAGNITLSDVYGQQFICTLTKTGVGTLTLGGTGENGSSGNPIQLAVNAGTVVLAKTSTGTAADADGTDSFTYTVSDPYGGTDIKTVTVNVQSGGSVGQRATITLTGGNVNLQFWGVPGQTYTVQFSTDLVSWSDLTPTVPANSSQPLGQINFTDTRDLSGTGYYRLKP